MSTDSRPEQRVRAEVASALTRLFGPSTHAPTDIFSTEYWGRRPLLRTAAERDGGVGDRDVFADLFSLEAVDELLSRRGLRVPFLRMAKDGATLPDSAFTSGGGIGAGIADQINEDKVLRLFAGGATLVLQGLHRTWSPMIDFSQQLAAELGHPVQVNAYITPPQNQGFSDHYDVHDVFVLQVHGRKHWRIHEPVLRSPGRDQPWSQRSAQVAAAAADPPSLEATLAPGDCLYLPRGYIHAATALGGISAHLTIGVHTWTRQHLAQHLLDAVGQQVGEKEDDRLSLPLGIDVADPTQWQSAVEATRQRLIDLVTKVPDEQVAEALAAAARAAQRPGPVAPLAHLADLDALDLASRLSLRPHLGLQVSSNAADLLLTSRASRCQVPRASTKAVERLREGESVAVRDLDPEPEQALQTARTLMVQGLAVVT